MSIWIILLLAAIGINMLVARVARERGRSDAGWVTLSVTAAFVALGGGLVLFGVAMGGAGGSDTALSMSAIIWSYLASLFAPLAAMLGVLAILWRLPGLVPQVGGARWSMYRMSTKELPGADCVIAVEDGRLRIGAETIVEAKDLTEIATDGECLRLSWGGRAAHFVPVDKPDVPRSAGERARFTLGLSERLRVLLGRAPRR